MKRIVLAVLLVAACVAHAQAEATRSEPSAEDVDAIFKRYDSRHSPGCSVAVIDDGEVVLKKSYGMADPSLGVPMTSSTSFWIPYSEARVFVALAVAMLARDGQISLDDPIRRHIPQVPAYAAEVTVRQLLNHSSGLADYGVLLPSFDSMWTRTSEDEFFRVLTRWNKLGFTPGQQTMYSNTDYALLEMLVERVSGGTLHDYLHEKLLAPLGMADTRIGADQAVVHPGHALFHTPDGEGWRRVFPYRTSPVGGISVTTSLDDLVRWDAALRDPASGLASMLEQLEAGAPATQADPQDEGHAFGVFRRKHQGLSLVEYRGIGGYRYLVQAGGLSVATLCSAYPGMDSFGPQVAMLYAGQPPAEASADAPAASVPPPEIGPVVDLAPAELERYAGEYRNASGQSFTIAVVGKGLTATPRGGATYPPLLPLGEGRFRSDFGESTYLLTFTTDGGDMVMTSWDVTANESGGQDLRRTATPAWAPSAAFGAYPGTYVGDDVEYILHVRTQDGRVLVAGNGMAEAALEPLEQADHFKGPDIYTTRFERDASGKVVALVLDATRVKGMRYARRQP